MNSAPTKPAYWIGWLASGSNLYSVSEILVQLIRPLCELKYVLYYGVLHHMTLREWTTTVNSYESRLFAFISNHMLRPLPNF